MTTEPIPRYRLGEVAYQGLWWAALALPALVVLIRVATTTVSGIFFLYVVIGIPATIVAQVMAGLLAWTYRKRQWRHFLGPVASIGSFVYYGMWALLALTLPEVAGTEPTSLVGRLLGDGTADALSVVLLVAVPSTYVALLVAIVVEGTRAVRRLGAEAG